MCRPCQAKEILNQEALRAVRDGEKFRKKVERAVAKESLTEDQAERILRPLMAADEGYISMGASALELVESLMDRELS